MSSTAPSLFGIDARIWQAILAGAFVALGWIVNGAQNRREQRNARAERLRDAHRAVFAEISAYLANLVSADALEIHRAAMIERMEADPGFVPFVPRERADRVFAALVGEIHILPRVTIDPIVTYYTHLHAIEAIAEDMRGERFAALTQDRRIAIYGDYISMKVLALAYGEHALAMIRAFSDGGKSAAEAVLSSRVSAQSGR